MFSHLLLFIKLAWRNIFRNKRRTIITAISMGIGLTSLIFTDALIVGMKEHMVNSATSSFLGQAQIHREGFLETYNVDKVVKNKTELINQLNDFNEVKNFTSRTLSYATIASANDVKAVNLVGVDPVSEADLSLFNESTGRGTFFDDHLRWLDLFYNSTGFEKSVQSIFAKNILKEPSNPRDIVIGMNIARELDVDIGSRVVVTVNQADNQGLYQEMFRVSGIFYFHNKEFDNQFILIDIEKSQEILNLNDNIHEIAIIFNNSDYVNDSTAEFFTLFSQNGNKAQSWISIMPQVQDVFKLVKISITIVAAILFFLVAFGLINTIFMSIFDRIYEFGVLRAVGTRRRDLIRLIIFETGSISLISIAVGVLMSLIICSFFSKIGISYSGVEYQGLILNVIYTRIKLYQYLLYPSLLFLFTLIIGLYPSIYVARISPANAMRKTI